MKNEQKKMNALRHTIVDLARIGLLFLVGMLICAIGLTSEIFFGTIGLAIFFGVLIVSLVCILARIMYKNHLTADDEDDPNIPYY